MSCVPYILPIVKNVHWISTSAQLYVNSCTPYSVHTNECSIRRGWMVSTLRIWITKMLILWIKHRITPTHPITNEAMTVKKNEGQWDVTDMCTQQLSSTDTMYGDKDTQVRTCSKNLPGISQWTPTYLQLLLSRQNRDLTSGGSAKPIKHTSTSKTASGAFKVENCNQVSRQRNEDPRVPRYCISLCSQCTGYTKQAC